MEYGVNHLRKQVAEGVRRLKRMAQTAESRRHEDTLQSVALLTGAREQQPWERLTERLAQWEQKLALQGRFEGMENLIPCFYPQTAGLVDYFKPGCLVLPSPSGPKSG